MLLKNVVVPRTKVSGRFFDTRRKYYCSYGESFNDELALKNADIGVAMGKKYSSCKRSVDMVLIEDNFTSIVATVKENRGVCSDICKFLPYILNSNLPEVNPSALFLFSGGKITLLIIVIKIW